MFDQRPSPISGWEASQQRQLRLAALMVQDFAAQAGLTPGRMPTVRDLREKGAPRSQLAPVGSLYAIFVPDASSLCVVAECALHECKMQRV